MLDWQPRQFNPAVDVEEEVQRLSRHGVDGVLCPACGAHRIPEELTCIEYVPHEITGGVKWACGACVSGWVTSGRITRGALARAQGAPEEHAAALEAADLPDLAALDVSLLAEIDRQAEAQRSLHITYGPGQAMTYEMKRTELARFDAGEQGPFPFLEAEAQACGLTLEEVASEVRAAADAWLAIGSAIEGKRRAAKRAVQLAATESEKRAAAQVNWSI